jgi:hypothetical protein
MCRYGSLWVIARKRDVGTVSYSVNNKVANPHLSYADLDPVIFRFNADPDPAPLQSDGNLRLLVYRPCEGSILFSRPPLWASTAFHGPPWLYSEPLKLFNFDFDADPVPYPAFWSNVDPDSDQCSGPESGSTGSTCFLPPGSGSTSQRYGSGSGSFYHHAKIIRKILNLAILWLSDFLSLKNNVNLPSKSNKQKLCKKIIFLLASWRSVTKIAGSGSISQWHGSADPDPNPHQNVMDPEHWFRLHK